MAFLKDYSVLEVFQSGFKSLHSTESALLRVFNYIFLATDSGDRVILVLLDLTAAFDTVDHAILYLAYRTFCVSLGHSVLLCSSLVWGPAGLGPRPSSLLSLLAPAWLHT